jgi:hypothetical protein
MARGELGPQHFNRDLPLMTEVMGEVDCRHAALAEFPLDAVALGQSLMERMTKVGHERGSATSVATRSRTAFTCAWAAGSPSAQRLMNLPYASAARARSPSRS